MQQLVDRLKTKYQFDICCDKVETSIGTLDVKKVKEYNLFSQKTGIILMDKSDLISVVKSVDNRLGRLLEVQHTLDFLKLIDREKITVFGINMLVDMFRKAFEYLFGEDVLLSISTKEEYDDLVLLIKWVHGLPVEMENPNPVIAKLDKVKKTVMSGGQDINFDTMYSTVWIATGNKPDDMTLYQFQELFHRFSMIKQYETSTLFKTVDSKGTIDVMNWYENKNKDTKKYVDIEKIRGKTF